MRALFLWLCLPLLPVSLFSDGGKTEAPFIKGEGLFAATLYAEAIPYYERNEDPALAPLASLRIGQARLYLGDYSGALASFASIPAGSLANREEEEKVFLSAIALRHLQRYDEVVAALSGRDFNANKEPALFELGLALYMIGKPAEARSSFKKLESAADGELRLLASFYLARIDLAGGDAAAAAAQLLALEPPKNPLLYREYAYLKGVAAFQKGEYEAAAQNFLSALGEEPDDQAPWARDVLYQLAWSYIRLAGTEGSNADAHKEKHLDAAIAAFQRLQAGGLRKQDAIGLAYAHLMRASELNDPSGYILAEQILGSVDIQEGGEAADYTLLMRAEAASTFEAREVLYQALTEASQSGSPLHAKGWYLKGVNELEEARRGKSPALYEQAALSFEKAYASFSKQKDPLASTCLKLQAQALWEHGSMDNKAAALRIVQRAMDAYPDEEEWEELFGIYAVHVIGENATDKILRYAEETLRQRSLMRKTSSSALALASFYLKIGQYEEARKGFLAFAEKDPASLKAPQALLQAALAMEHLPASAEAVRELRRKVYEQYPTSPTAPQAYFLTYSYQEYLQGDRAAIKHLTAFKERFPESPMAMNVDYLLGLDLKRDRKSPEGRWVRKKNVVQSVQAFNDVVADFDHFYEGGKIPHEDLDYYIKLRFRAILERGLVHYGVAEESNAAKRDIYFQYAIDTFEQLRNELEDPANTLAASIRKEGAFPRIHEECLYWLALAHMHAGGEASAAAVFEEMLERYRLCGTTAGYYLSRVYCELGMAAAARRDHDAALAFFLKGEEASKGKYLGIDEKLDLWMRQSESYRQLSQMENAMLALSKVINDDSVSQLRLKAMYLRASLYEQLGRPELARRQLEALAKLGGKWSEQAKLKLEHDYATQ